jgi:hypothetical protein
MGIVRVAGKALDQGGDSLGFGGHGGAVFSIQYSVFSIQNGVFGFSVRCLRVTAKEALRPFR